MKRHGIIHAELCAALAGLRHTDLFAVSDSGLPVPPGVPVIDLGIVYGLPRFLDVLEPVLDLVEIEKAWTSHDLVEANPELYESMTARLDLQLQSHEEFKKRVADCRFVVRSGEATPYANVIARSGVPW